MISLNVATEIQLKTIDPKEANTLFALIETNRNYLRAFLGWLDQNSSIKHTEDFIGQEIENLKNFKSVTLGIYYSEKLVGVISLHEMNLSNRIASVGYWLDQAHQGKGIVTRSAKTLIRYAFEKLQLHRLELRCAVHNHRSSAIACKLGFIQEGLLKEAIFNYDRYFDAYIYGLVSY